MPGLCEFRTEWLTDPNYSQWIKRVPSDQRQAFCRICSKTISLCRMRECALKSHMDGKKHNEGMKITSRQSIVQAFAQVSTPAEDSTAKPVTGTGSGMLNISKVAADAQYAEILWTLHTVAKHHSYKSQEENNELFTTMFKDSAIAGQYKCGETKTRYLTTFGLAPFFKQQLSDELQKSEFTLMFDESLNKENQKNS